ncbi:MAG TPA: 4-alpha-glucanotransferase [Kofleriaceae bacterium]|nr:4-alpha-glucanotransferase [Kofleriaceae bacterium]
MSSRGAGILLHASSLAGPHGSGDLGDGARSFVDWLAAAGQRWWQFLPINPVGQGASPYSGASAFAGETTLISLEDLVDEGLLVRGEIAGTLPADRVDHAAAHAVRDRALRHAFTRFRAGREYERFERDSASWLPDHALFEALRRAHPNQRWTQWPDALRRREPAALVHARQELANEIAFASFTQFVFAQQWARLRSYARGRGVGLIGDIPIFVAHDSADVWANQDSFTLDPDTGEATHVAGVPPDYFSETGQRWGNPHYRWKRMAKSGYRWWIDRFRTLLERFDLVRLDHFIGFVRYWRIPASEETAVNGTYVRGPGAHFFAAVQGALGKLPFIAEDLGSVTPAVIALRDRFALPGMRVFQFGFGTDVQAAEFKPHRYVRNCVAYSGTHDNDTIVGWFDTPGPRPPEQHVAERAAAIEYLAGPGATKLARPVHVEILRALYTSVADTVIAPMQDVLGLPSDARMNTPGLAEGNWAWRVQPDTLTDELAHQLRALAATYDRLPSEET